MTSNSSKSKFRNDNDYSMSDILQEFEELLRLKEYYSQGNIDIYKASFKQIREALGKEYVDNIDEKITRWLNVTKVEYFYNKLPVVLYFEAKMLFRDGYFEAVVSMSRIIGNDLCRNSNENFSSFRYCSRN